MNHFTFDYFQDEDYGFLLRNYKSIAKILTNKLQVLRDLDFDSSEAYLFGFSFGARLIVKAATDFGPKKIGTIHCKNDLYSFLTIFQLQLSQLGGQTQEEEEKKDISFP